MKSIKEYNNELRAIDCKIRVFNAEGGAASFALVRIKPNQSFLKKVLGLDTIEVIIHSIDEQEVLRTADQLLGAEF